MEHLEHMISDGTYENDTGFIEVIACDFPSQNSNIGSVEIL
jgi:hypothetical protein